jgi:hypothetical protein
MVDERVKKELEEGPHYETQPVNFKVPIGTAIGVIILLPVTLAIVFLLLHFQWKTTPGPKPYPFDNPPATTPAPRLLVHPEAELHAVESLARQRLHSYGWVDKKKGVVHIPIDQAIDIIAKHGFPPRPPRPKNARPQVPIYRTGTANAGGGPP